MKKADLHIHTTVSDGRLTPTEVVRESFKRDLGLIAITDHDTFEGYFEAVKEAGKLGIEVILGAELTSEYNDQECHLLAYGFDPTDKGINDLVTSQKRIRVDRAQKIIGNLNKLGFDVTYDEVRAEAGVKGVVARPHIANVLIRKGYAGNHREVFMRYLGNHARAYHKCEYRKVDEIAKIVRNAGGVTILAHPGKNYKSIDLLYFIEAGIDGFEYIHPSHNYELQRKYEHLADEYGLLKSGGSDFHGVKFEDNYNFGVVSVNMKVAERIIDFCKQRKKHHKI